MTDLPLVSVITPSLNQGRFIEETLLSVKNQDYPKIEHIIVDGGSTDRTLDILKRYEGCYNIRWISEPDRGQADAICKGFRLAEGEILCWLNSDDVYVSPSTISRVVSLMKDYPTGHVVAGGGVYLTETGHWDQLIEASQKHSSHQFLRYCDSILQPATFFRRIVLETVQMDRSLQYGFDWDFFIRVAEHFNLLVANEIWAGYRLWGSNKTFIGGAPRVREALEITRRYLGKTSWQYWVVGLYYLLYRGAEWMPAPLRDPLRRMVKKASIFISFLCSKRITTI